MMSLVLATMSAKEMLVDIAINQIVDMVVWGMTESRINDAIYNTKKDFFDFQRQIAEGRSRAIADILRPEAIEKLVQEVSKVLVPRGDVDVSDNLFRKEVEKYLRSNPDLLTDGVRDEVNNKYDEALSKGTEQFARSVAQLEVEKKSTLSPFGFNVDVVVDNKTGEKKGFVLEFTQPKSSGRKLPK